MASEEVRDLRHNHSPKERNCKTGSTTPFEFWHKKTLQNFLSIRLCIPKLNEKAHCYCKYQKCNQEFEFPNLLNNTANRKKARDFFVQMLSILTCSDNHRSVQDINIKTIACYHLIRNKETTPYCCNAKRIKVLSPVRSTPIQTGILKSMFNAKAVPITAYSR